MGTYATLDTKEVIDNFRNDVSNRHESYVIPNMLAKNVGISVSVVEMSKEMDSARAILQLQKSASEEELLSTLQRLTVQRLNFLCKETAVPISWYTCNLCTQLAKAKATASLSHFKNVCK